MASGLTNVFRYMSFAPTEDYPQKDRDRSLRGRQRVRARKRANKRKG